MKTRCPHPSPTETADRIADFAVVARPLIRNVFRADSCIASTRIAIAVLGAFGLRVEPISATVQIDNAILHRLLSGNPTPSAADVKTWQALGAHGVAIGQGIPARRMDNDGWHGHLIAVANGTWLIDASADQMNRPKAGIELPGVFVSRLPTPLPACPSAIEMDLPNGAYLTYGLHPSNRTFRTARDWELSGRAQAVVQKIVGAMLKRHALPRAG